MGIRLTRKVIRRDKIIMLRFFIFVGLIDVT